MITVFATREGLEGKPTASGYIIDKIVPYVALPSVKALGKFVKLIHPVNGNKCYAVVLDVGPWNTHDDNYVFGLMGQRPASEYNKDISNTNTNRAGIDLGDKVWQLLGMTDNDMVTWEFLE